MERECELQRRVAYLSRLAGVHDPLALAEQLVLVLNGALTTVSLFGAAFPATHLTTIVAHLIDLHLVSSEASF